MITTTVVNAAESVPLDMTSFENIQKQFNLRLPGIRQASIASNNTLMFLQQHVDKQYIAHIRMQQEYEGFPVLGGYAIIHTPGTTHTLLSTKKVDMNGVIYRGLEQELGHAGIDFTKNGTIALEQFKKNLGNQKISEQQVTPVVYIDTQKKAHWAYQVSVYINHNNDIPKRPTAIVDAVTYQPFIEWNDIKTVMMAAKAMGFGGNKKMGEYSYGKNYPLLDITRETKTNTCFLETLDVRVVDMKHDYFSKNKAMSFPCRVSSKNLENTFWTGYKGNGYDRNNGAYSPTNDALYAGYVIKHMYHDWYGVEVLVDYKTNLPMQLIMRVHYGDGYENAYWDGRQMTFGDGEDMMYPLVSLGVGAHEVSHGFTEQHSDLAYFGQSGGMNESFSDMASQVAEFYSTGQNSWQIGADIMKEASGYDALRYMDEPSRDGVSIDTVNDYDGSLDVHQSSGIYNKLYYLIATTPGWDARKAFDIMVKANMDYWVPFSTFDQGACGLLRAANDLGMSTADIKKSLDRVAIKYNTCGR
jgi:pseudolysin